MDELAAAAAVKIASMEVDHEEATLANEDAGSPADVDMHTMAGEVTRGACKEEASDLPSAGERKPNVHLLFVSLMPARDSC